MEGLGQWPFMIAIFVIFFVFMILPQRRRQKEEKKFSEGMKKGDRIITKSGLHGKIMELSEKDSSCIIETMAGKLKFDRTAISMEMSKKLSAPAVKK